MSGFDRVEQLALKIGNFDYVHVFQPVVYSTRLILRVRYGKHEADIEMSLEDLEVADDHLMSILLEDRLSGVREWAHWEQVASENT